jgi:saccharopine dehydrogenase-like NADP-dependent oxidoreductase
MRDGLPFRILLVGASGVFGSRLAERLAVEPGIALTLAGRRSGPLAALASRIGGGAVRTVDRDRIEPRDLAGYDLVIDAAGPFQMSGTALIDAAIGAGVDYMDLSDGREWVVGFAGRFDQAARRAGVSLVAGASSLPALSHAVIDRLVEGWTGIDRIWIGIFPGNRTERGLSVMKAILSYAGKPVRQFRQGRWQSGWGWGQLRRVDLGPLGRRWASLCDTPEQDLLVSRYRPRTEATFVAGLELSLLHLGLWLLSLPVRLGLVPSLRPAAGLMLAFANALKPFGSDRGGMLVRVSGQGREGEATAAEWLLDAPAARGPYVPTLAALAMVRRWREGRRPQAGAYACSGLLGLPEFDADFEALGITTSTGGLRQSRSR